MQVEDERDGENGDVGFGNKHQRMLRESRERS